MSKRKQPSNSRVLAIDHVSLNLRKPTAGPLVQPDEAIAIALSMLPAKSTGQLCTPDCPAVRHVLLAIKMAGWKLEAI